MRRRLSIAIFFLALVGCSGGAQDPTTLMIGERELPPVPDGAFQIVTPVLEIPAGTEQFWCFYGEYDGPEVGIHKMVVHQDPTYGHHSLLKEPLPDDHPTGSLVNCSSLMEQIPPRPTLFEAVRSEDLEEEEDDDEEHGGVEHPGFFPEDLLEPPDEWIEGIPWVNLPPDIGFRFVQGQKWMADVHFVNTSSEPILTRAVFDLYTVPSDEVTAFVGTFNHDAGAFALPAQEQSTINFDCVWDEDSTILSIGGHMHQYGTHFQVDHLNEAGDLQAPSIYELDWENQYRFTPPVVNFAPGEFEVSAGDAFRTWCSWNNTRSETLSYPEEMCTTFGVAYPAPDSLYCVVDEHNPGGTPP